MSMARLEIPRPADASRRQFLSAAALGVAAVVVGVGCGDDDSEGASKSGGGDADYSGKISGPHLTTITPGAVLVIAKEKGFYSEQGLDLDNVTTDGGSAAIQQVMTATHMGMSSGLAAYIATSKFKDLRIVGGLLNAVDGAFLIPADSKLTLDDLKGTKVGSGSPQGVDNYWLELLLESRGLTKDDVEVVYLGDPSTAWTATERGVVDFTSSVEPVASMRVREGDAKVLFRVAEVRPKEAYNVLIADRTFADENPEVVKAWLAAVQESIDFIKASPSDAGEVWSKAAKIPADVATEVLRTAAPAMTTQVDLEAMTLALESAQALGQAPKGVDAAAAIDDRFLPPMA